MEKELNPMGYRYSTDVKIGYLLGLTSSNLTRISFAFLTLFFETVLLFFIIPFPHNLSFQQFISPSKQAFNDSGRVSLKKTYPEGTCYASPILKRANLRRADLKGADLSKTNLKEADITIEQLSEVRTLYKATLDPSIMEQIRRDYPHLLEKP